MSPLLHVASHPSSVCHLPYPVRSDSTAACQIELILEHGSCFNIKLNFFSFQTHIKFLIFQELVQGTLQRINFFFG
jgi:hypothetical protein